MTTSDQILILAPAGMPVPDTLLASLVETGHTHRIAAPAEAAEIFASENFAAAIIRLERIDAGLLARAVALRAACGLAFPFVAVLAEGCEPILGGHPFDAVLPHDASCADFAAAIRPREGSQRDARQGPALRARIFPVERETLAALPEGIVRCVGDDLPQVAILRGPRARQALREALGVVVAAAIPTVALDDQAPTCDISAPEMREGLPGSIRELAARFDAVREAVLRSEDPRVALLARMVVRDRPCVPVLDAASRSLATYADEAFVAPLAPKAEALVRAGLAQRSFFEKLHVCPSCASSRMVVREVCGACGSGDVHEAAIVHHFRCGHQAPEDDFRRGEDLVCPRCVRQLEHFGFDYDRPGVVTVCRACGHTTGEAAVGFICLDCSARHSADRVETRTFYAYEATDLGRRMMFATSADLDLVAPDEEAEALRAALNGRRRAGRAPTLLTVLLDADKSASSRRRTKVLAHIDRSLRELFVAPDMVLPWRGGFVVLLADADLAQARSAIPAFREKLSGSLQVVPGLTIEAHELDALRSIGQAA